MQRSSRDKLRARPSSLGSASISSGCTAIAVVTNWSAINAAIAKRPNQAIDLLAETDQRGPRTVGELRSIAIGYSAGCAAARVLAGLGAPTRSRRSDSDIAPPSTMTAAPSQISNTSGL